MPPRLICQVGELRDRFPGPVQTLSDEGFDQRLARVVRYFSEILKIDFVRPINFFQQRSQVRGNHRGDVRRGDLRPGGSLRQFLAPNVEPFKASSIFLFLYPTFQLPHSLLKVAPVFSRGNIAERDVQFREL